MPSLAVAINFNVFKNSLTHLLSIYYWLIVNGFDLERVEETFHASIIPAISFTAHALSQLMLIYELSISRGAILAACRITRPGKPRRHNAICSASHTNVAVILELIDQPITAREYRTIITAKYSQPSLVYK